MLVGITLAINADLKKRLPAKHPPKMRCGFVGASPSLKRKQTVSNSSVHESILVHRFQEDFYWSLTPLPPGAPLPGPPSLPWLPLSP